MWQLIQRLVRARLYRSLQPKRLIVITVALSCVCIWLFRETSVRWRVRSAECNGIEQVIRSIFHVGTFDIYYYNYARLTSDICYYYLDYIVVIFPLLTHAKYSLRSSRQARRFCKDITMLFYSLLVYTTRKSYVRTLHDMNRF